MAEERADKRPCLWHTPDGRCANCKARRYRLDPMGMKEGYGECRGPEDYAICVFYKPGPAPKT